MKTLTFLFSFVSMLSAYSALAERKFYSDSGLTISQKVEVEKESKRHLVIYLEALRAAAADVFRNINADKVDYLAEMNQFTFKDKKTLKSIFGSQVPTLVKIKTQFTRYRGVQTLNDLLKEIVGIQELLETLDALEKLPNSREIFNQILDRHFSVQKRGPNEDPSQVEVLDVLRGDGCLLYVTLYATGAEAAEECD